MNVIGLNSTSGIGSLSSLTSLNNTKNNTDNNSQINFSQILNQQIDNVNSKQIQADTVTNNFIKGDETDIHKVMISMEEAKMSLQLAVQVRNKLLEAYQEISRIQL